MAVVISEEIHKGSGSFTLEGRTITRYWQVDTNDINDGPAIVTDAVPIELGEQYETPNEEDLKAFCSEINASRVSPDGLKWEVEIKYTELEDSESDPNPLNQPADEQWDFVKYQQPINIDIHGAPILNTAGMNYQNQLYRDGTRAVLRITRNEPSFNASRAQLFSNNVNADFFRGARPGTCMINSISGRRIVDAVYGPFFQVVYQFEFRADNFKMKLVSQGIHEKDGTKFKRIADDKGVECTEPVNLDKDGKKLPPHGTPVVQNWEVQNKIPFAIFGL